LTGIAISRAPQRLAMAAGAPLAAGLAELERELGITIIKRNRSFQGITPEGERVLAWAHQVLASLDGLKQEAALVRQVAGGHVSIGTIPSAVAPLSALVSVFARGFPPGTLEVHALSTPELYRRIKKGEIDLAVVYADAQEEDGFDYSAALHRTPCADCS
jgi:DNA-binding transcriptional LysR family regulator